MLWKCCTQYASKFGKLSSGHRTGKGQFSFQSQRMLKLPHNCTHLAPHSSTLAWKIPWTEEPGRLAVHGVTKSQTWLSDFTFLYFPKHAKECSNYRTIALISHASKGMLKILQARLQQYMNRELPDVQAGFRKGRGIRDQIVNIHWIIEKAREFQKNIYICFLMMPKPLTTINCGKFWKRWESQTTWPASWETCMQVRKQQLELDMEQQTGSK